MPLLPCSSSCRCRYASVFQMLRGTLVIFAGLLTIVLLKRRLHSHHCKCSRARPRAQCSLAVYSLPFHLAPCSSPAGLGMVLICAGAVLVGASSVIYDRSGTRQHAQGAAAPLLHQLLLGRGGGSSGSGSSQQQRHTAPSLADEGIAPDPLLGNILVVIAQVGEHAEGGRKGGRRGLRATSGRAAVCSCLALRCVS